MSHDLNVKDAKVSMAFNRHNGMPWHNLGQQVPGAMTFAEAITLGQADYTVEKRPIFATDKSPEGPDADMALPSISVPHFYATIRTDTQTPLGVVGERYRVVQNVDAFRVFDPVVGEGRAAFDTVGVLGKGERFFVLAKLPESVMIGTDEIARYMLFVNSHDGTLGALCMLTGVRVVCRNTVQAALGRRGKGARHVVNVRHTASANRKLEQAHELLDVADGYWSRAREAFEAMQRTNVTRQDVKAFCERIFPGKVEALEGEIATTKAIEQAEAQGIGAGARTLQARQRVAQIFDGDGPGQGVGYSNVWGLYNAALYYFDHDRTLKGTTNRWEASQFGSGTALRDRAFEVAASLV
jgi:phage/plasmid-like protein (TIGR03299 family)